MSKVYLVPSPGLYQPIKNTLYKKPPLLKHGLESIISKPGPHFLRNSNMGFSKYLETMPNLKDFDLTLLKPFISASFDKNLRKIAKEQNALFSSSTSSISGIMAQIYTILTSKKNVINHTFTDEIQENLSRAMSPFVISGSKIKIFFNDGVYAVEIDKEQDEENVLMKLGTVLELFFTKSPEQFKRFSKNRKTTASEEELHGPESYHYAKFQDILLRSQLDAHDPSVPRSTFDLKTRATLAIRKDIKMASSNTWYEITDKLGKIESFEREYYDMLRASFLKYSLQVRIGNMGGIFVAYHNIDTVFGFEYISLEEMEEKMFGSEVMGEQVFSLSTQILNLLLKKVVEEFPEQDSQVMVSKPKRGTFTMYIQPSNPNPGQIPIEVEVKISSYVNGVLTPEPLIKKNDIWTVELEVRKIEYDTLQHTSAKKQYDKLFAGGSSRFGGSFIRTLKEEVRLKRLRMGQPEIKEVGEEKLEGAELIREQLRIDKGEERRKIYEKVSKDVDEIQQQNPSMEKKEASKLFKKLVKVELELRAANDRAQDKVAYERSK